MRNLYSSNRRVTRSQTDSRINSKELERKQQGESESPVFAMASQPSDPPPITLITSTLPVVQLVGLLSATRMVPLPSFDENPNQDLRAHVQSFFNAVVMSLVNDDRYALLWFSSTLKGKALE
jgi:hypothetical protein